MKVEFFSKQGVIEEMARLQQKTAVLLLSGQFAPMEYWDVLIPDQTKREDEEEGTVSAMAYIMHSQGSLTASFDQFSDAIQWLTELKNNQAAQAEKTSDRTPTACIAYLFSDEGVQIDQFYIDQFDPTKYTTGAANE